MDLEPSYLALLRSGALERRVEQALESLSACEGCARAHGVDRLAEHAGLERLDHQALRFLCSGVQTGSSASSGSGRPGSAATTSPQTM